MNWEIAQGLAQVLRETVPTLRVEVQDIPGARQRYVILASVTRKGKRNTITITDKTEFALVLASLEIQAEKLQRQMVAIA